MPDRRSHRRVLAAVDAVCDAAASSEGSVTADGGADSRPRAWAPDRDRSGNPARHRSVRSAPEPTTITMVIVLAPGLPMSSEPLAHELGHIVFRHEGAEIAEATLEVSDDLIAYMLSQRSLRRNEPVPMDDIAEWEAETFASMLIMRLRTMSGRGTPLSVLRYDEAIG